MPKFAFFEIAIQIEIQKPRLNPFYHAHVIAPCISSNNSASIQSSQNCSNITSSSNNSSGSSTQHVGSGTLIGRDKSLANALARFLSLLCEVLYLSTALFIDTPRKNNRNRNSSIPILQMPPNKVQIQ